MTPEEYQRIKEAEKEHLRSLRKLKDAVRSLDRQRKVSGAVRDMAEGGAVALDASSDAVDRLALETAHNEARLEVALESTALHNSEADADKLAEAEEALRRERARELVRQLRGETEGYSKDAASTAATAESPAGGAGPSSDSGSASSRPAASPSTHPDTPPLPEKTIGRMKP